VDDILEACKGSLEIGDIIAEMLMSVCLYKNEWKETFIQVDGSRV